MDGRMDGRMNGRMDGYAALKWNPWSRVVNLCTEKSWRSSGNHIRTALLGHSSIDAKRSLDLLLTFYVEVLHYYSVLKHHKEKQGMRRRSWWILSRVTTCLHLLLVLFGSVRAPQFLKTSANTSQLMNFESLLINSTYDVVKTTRGRRSYGLFLRTRQHSKYDSTEGINR